MCGPPGSLVAWADGVCAALQPHGFTAADVGAMAVRYPRLLTCQPSVILGCIQAMCASLIPPARAGTADGAATVRRACVSSPSSLLNSGTLPALLKSYVESGVARSEDHARALLLSAPSAMGASRHRPWQVGAAVVAAVAMAEAGAMAEAAWLALRGGYSIEGRVLPRLLWHCQLPCAPVFDSMTALASMPQFPVPQSIFKPTECCFRTGACASTGELGDGQQCDVQCQRRNRSIDKPLSWQRRVFGR